MKTRREVKPFIKILSLFALIMLPALTFAARDQMRERAADPIGPRISRLDQDSKGDLALRQEILKFAQDTFNDLAKPTGFPEYTTEAAKKLDLNDIVIGIPKDVKNADSLATYTVVDPSKRRVVCWNPKFWNAADATLLQKRRNVINAFSTSPFQKTVLTDYLNGNPLKPMAAAE